MFVRATTTFEVKYLKRLLDILSHPGAFLSLPFLNWWLTSKSWQFFISFYASNLVALTTICLDVSKFRSNQEVPGNLFASGIYFSQGIRKLPKLVTVNSPWICQIKSNKELKKQVEADFVIVSYHIKRILLNIK